MAETRVPMPGFDDFGGRTWLNSAHQGALPLAAAQEARTAVEWKTSPFELTQERFDDVPKRLRVALGRLVNVPSDDIILANSASYGLNLIGTAYPWREGDEVLLMAGDFPSDILPWLLLERRHGVKVIQIKPRGRIIEPDELEAAITPRTRMFCTTWVHSLSGFAIDIEALGQICRNHGVVSVINGSQAIGARPLDLSRTPIDVFTSVGFKWLCSPYGTGFCWIKPELRERLVPTKAYWLSMLTAADLAKDLGDVKLPETPRARDYDVFGTANFFNFVPFAATIEHLLKIGLDRIRDHDQALVSRFVNGLDNRYFTVTSPVEEENRSTLVFFSHKDRNRNEEIYQSLRKGGVYISFRGGSLRLAPHLYNGDVDIDKALAALGQLA